MAHIRNIVGWGVAAVAVLHGLIHFLGASKGFGWSVVSALKKPTKPSTGPVPGSCRGVLARIATPRRIRLHRVQSQGHRLQRLHQ